jgi:hypothetical protein
MSAGYVYILINTSMPGLIKIGRTLRDSRSRARELQTTGVPTAFEVAFEVFSENHENLEDTMHNHLADFRVSGNREFFRYPLRDAIALLQQYNRPVTEPDVAFVAESIYHPLVNRYADWLRPDIVDVRIVQASERVWLEVTQEEIVGGYLRDQTIKRTDLGFIVSGDPEDTPLFRHDDAVSENARKFVEEFSPYSIVHTTNLFREEACLHVDAHHNPHRGRLDPESL